MEPTIDHAIAAVADGSYKAEDYGLFSYMAHGGGSVVVDAALVPADVVSMIEAKKAAIMDGSFTVTVNNDEPVSDK